jgi:serine/threonine protein kinase
MVARDEETQMKILEEYSVHASLRHICITSVLELHTIGSQMYLRMEHYNGGSVESCITGEGPMIEPVAQVLFSQLLRGVDYMHSKRIVHRDLKPSNLLLVEDANELKIVDFGSATDLSAKEYSSMLTCHAGTSLYLAPEVHFGYHWNERVDIWSCGLCFYFMLKADLPFNMDSRKVRRVLHKGRLPDWDAKSMSMAASNLVYQCLQVSVWDRPPAMELRLHPMFNRNFGLPLADFECSADPGESKCNPETITSDASPKSFYSLSPQCGLLCLHPFQKMFPESLEQPSSSMRCKTLQALADTKCLRGMAMMSRASSSGLSRQYITTSSTSCGMQESEEKLQEFGKKDEATRTTNNTQQWHCLDETTRQVSKELEQLRLDKPTRMTSKGAIACLINDTSVEQSFGAIKAIQHGFGRQWSAED